MKIVNKFFLHLVFFSVSIFFLKDYFLWAIYDEKNIDIENKYIDPSIIKKEYIIEDKKKEEKKNIELELNSAYNIDYIFVPRSFKNDILNYTNDINIFLNNKEILKKIIDLKIELHKEKNDVRWKMKNHTLKLFWVKNMKENEFEAVSIHEFAHYIDLYYLEKKVFTDLSDYFYNISWASTKVLKAWQIQENFVSWYAMTNKYEDFAESFTYYVLHNEDFLRKTEKSEVLKSKYDFFTKYVFRNDFLKKTNFWSKEKIKNYYRDITKIDFSLENFLEFLKK